MEFDWTNVQISESPVDVKDGTTAGILYREERMAVCILEAEALHWGEGCEGTTCVWMYAKRAVLRVLAFRESRQECVQN